MFARKPKSTNSQVDELNRKKTAGKILDIKKDLNSRLRYLKNFIGKKFLIIFNFYRKKTLGINVANHLSN